MITTEVVAVQRSRSDGARKRKLPSVALPQKPRPGHEARFGVRGVRFHRERLILQRRPGGAAASGELAYDCFA
jgi:hypothetical protein